MVSAVATSRSKPLTTEQPLSSHRRRSVSPRRALWLGTSVPGFNARWLTNDFKQQVKDSATPTSRHSIGPLDVLFKRFNQDVRLTDRRLNLTIRYLAATQFNWTAGESTAGLRYWQSAEFMQAHTHCMALHMLHMHSPCSAVHTLHILCILYSAWHVQQHMKHMNMTCTCMCM